MASKALDGCRRFSVDDSAAVVAETVTVATMQQQHPTFLPARNGSAPRVLRSLIAELPALGTPDENGVRVPVGFRARIVARTGRNVEGTNYRWHPNPDGAATFATSDGGWIYVSNCETANNQGGVGALRFNANGSIHSAYRILDRTNMNCAGGPTPWRTWLSCEEHDHGRVYECDPWGENQAILRPALGVFRHEASTIDTEHAHVYLTEDQPDGRLYRFVPVHRTADGHPDLNAGQLEVAVVSSEGTVQWRVVPDPFFRNGTPTRRQVAESTRFNGGEGIWFHRGVVYFSTKGDDRVWAYDTRSNRLRVLYDARTYTSPPLRGVDNITVSCCGDVLVAEDLGSMQVVAILPSGGTKPLVQLVGQAGSEITGPAFDPSGTRLYFSSQRAPGITYEVSGPFHVAM